MSLHVESIAGLGRSISSQSMPYGICLARIGFMEAAAFPPPLLFVYYQDGVFTKTAVMCNDVGTSKMTRLTEQRSMLLGHIASRSGDVSGSGGVPD